MAIIKNPFMVVGDKNPLIANNEDELNALLTSKNAGKAVLYSGELYIVEGGEATENPTAVQLYTTPAGVPMTADTEEKANALLVENNVGRIFKYTGEAALVGTPPAVGDTIDKLYFNLNATVDCSLFDFGEDNHIQFMSYGADNVLEVYKAPAENSPTGKEEYYINNIFEGTETVIWASFAFAGLGWIEGWQQNIIDANGVFSIGETQTVLAVIQPNAWGSYISKEPFAAGGAYEKNALYLIAAGGGSGASNTPIAVGDTIDKLYFNTSVTPDFSNITWGKDNMATYMYFAGGAGMALFDMTAQGASGYLIMWNDSTFVYSSDGLSSEFMTEFWGEAITVPKGWNADLIANGGVLTLDAPDTVSEIDNQSEWSSYISKEAFGGSAIAAKKLQIAE